MGRTKGKHLHTVAEELMRTRAELFTESFDTNKDKIKELKIIEKSTKELNKLAGEVTNLFKRQKRKEAKENPAPAAPQASA